LNALGAHLLIRAGTFSDDMITTGISLSEEDPCIPELASKDEISTPRWFVVSWTMRIINERPNRGKEFNLRPLTFTLLSRSYPVMPGMQ
jgi:hypothetical protein